MQMRKERKINFEPKNHSWPLSRGHHKWKVQITSVSVETKSTDTSPTS